MIEPSDLTHKWVLGESLKDKTFRTATYMSYRSEVMYLTRDNNGYIITKCVPYDKTFDTQQEAEEFRRNKVLRDFNLNISGNIT